MNHEYDDIIDLPHYEPKNHQRMTIEARAAQFAPFSALTGYSEAIREVERRHLEEMERKHIDDEWEKE